MEKKRWIVGVVFFALGILISIGPLTIFKVCNVGSMLMKCHWTSKAELGVGGSIALNGLLMVCINQKKVHLGLTLAVFPLGILTILVPTALIGVCDSERMQCRMLTYPMLCLLGGLLIIISAVNMFFLVKKQVV